MKRASFFSHVLFALVASTLGPIGCAVSSDGSGSTSASSIGSGRPALVRHFRDPLSDPPSLHEIAERAEQDAESGDSTAALREFGSDWLYGHGVGRTLLNVGTSVLFPPYALYLVGNAGLALAGYQPLAISSVLPESARVSTLRVYDEVTSVPGLLVSGVAREKFRPARSVEPSAPTESEIEADDSASASPE